MKVKVNFVSPSARFEVHSFSKVFGPKLKKTYFMYVTLFIFS